MKKIMVFGCNGFVGTSLCTRAKELGWQISGADTAESPALADLEYYQCDITDRKSVFDAVASSNPDYTVNVAAIADIDFSEANQELAQKVNVVGAGNIALASEKVNAKHLFFSSDAVFSGTDDNGYTEDSGKAPVNFYGKTKSDAEELVMSSCKNSVVIRISLVVGFSCVSGNSFLDSMSKKLAAGSQIEAPLSDIRTPIDITTLCNCVLELYHAPFNGIIHLGSTESVNRYEIALEAARLLEFPDELIVAKDFSSPTKAPRHKKGIISVKLAQSTLKTPLCDFKETMRNAVNSKK